MQKIPAPVPVSSVLDKFRNRIDRYEGFDANGQPAVTLRITLAPDSPIDETQVEAWYWRKVGTFEPAVTWEEDRELARTMGY